MSEAGILNEVIAKSPNRRGFVRKLGLASAALGATAVTSKVAQAQSAGSGPPDVDILNFALNLEYLESEFYNIASTGLSIDQLGVDISGSGNLGISTGGHAVPFVTPAIQSLAVELAKTELEHVDLIRQTIFSLGGSPVARPPINLNALSFGFANENDFLVLARAFEEVGVSAYSGAAPLIANSSVLGASARILAVEAEHAGCIRWIISQRGLTTTAVDAADLLPPPSGTTYAAINSQGLTPVRTPGQVLYVVYGGSANATTGGFFTMGVNGNIKTSAAVAATIDGATLTLSPNPIHVSSPGTPGTTTVTWNAPSAQAVEVRVGGPNGALFAYGQNSGSASTAAWVVDGTMFYLQDANKAMTEAGTLAMVVAHVVTP